MDISTIERKSILKREVELGSDGELDYLLLQVSTAGPSDSATLCPAQLLTEQVVEYTNCFALAGSPSH